MPGGRRSPGRSSSRTGPGMYSIRRCRRRHRSSSKGSCSSSSRTGRCCRRCSSSSKGRGRSSSSKCRRRRCCSGSALHRGCALWQLPAERKWSATRLWMRRAWLPRPLGILRGQQQGALCFPWGKRAGHYTASVPSQTPPRGMTSSDSGWRGSTGWAGAAALHRLATGWGRPGMMWVEKLLAGMCIGGMPCPCCTLLLWVVLGGLRPPLGGGAVPRSRDAGAGLVN